MSQQPVVENQITEGSITKQLLLFFFPILLGTFFQQLYNTVDAIIVGRFVGKEALAAVGGSTGIIINLLVGFFVGLSSGATVIISQYYGAGKPKETHDSVHTAIALGIVGGFGFMLIGLILSPLLLRAMGTPDQIMDYALSYIRIYFSGMIANVLYNIGSGILRAIGDSKRPLYFLIIGTLLNVILDLFFVVILKLEVIGVGIATVLSQIISAALVLITLMRSRQVYQLILRDIRLHGRILMDIIRIGLPAGLQSVMYALSNLFIQSNINSFGTDTIAAWTAYGKIDGMFWMIMGAFGVAITTFSGQNFGAQKYHRVRKSVRVCLIMAAAAAMTMSVLLLLFGQFVYRLFTNDPAVISCGMNIMKTLVPFYFTYVCVEVLSGAVRGAGDALLPMLITCIGICVFRIIWIFTAVPFSHSLNMVIISYPLTWAITSVLFIIYYLQGGWLRRRIQKAGLSPEEK